SDISGVCSRGETLRITSRPTKVASIKTYSPSSRSECMCRSHGFQHARVHYLALMGDQRFAHDFVFAVERQPAVFHQMGEERCNIPRVHLAGVIRNGGGQVDWADDLDPVPLHRLAGRGEFAIAAAL